MIEEIATVISTDAGMAIIRVEKTSSCNSCQAKGACGTASFADYFNFKPPRFEVENTLNAGSGDRVVVGIPEQTLVAGSFLLYIVPLLLLIMFAFLAVFSGQFFPSLNQELFQTLAGLVGLAVGLIVVKRYSGRLLKDGSRASLVKILNSHAKQVPANQLQP